MQLQGNALLISLSHSRGLDQQLIHYNCGTGLGSISTTFNDTLTGTSRGINFAKRDGTTTFIDPSSNASTLGTTINTLFVPFTLRDGTKKPIIVMADKIPLKGIFNDW